MKKRMAPYVKALRRGARIEALDFGRLMDSHSDANAYLLLNPGRAGSAKKDFHCYALLYAVMDAGNRGTLELPDLDNAFIWSLSSPWSFVGTLGEAGTMFFLKMAREAFTQEPPPEILRGKPEWELPYLKAALRHWDTLAAEGPRYASAPLGVPKEFTAVGHVLTIKLFRAGLAKAPEDVAKPAVVKPIVERLAHILQN